jgi:integrase
MSKLTSRTVQTLGDGWHHDSHGLYLQVTNNGVGRSWVYKFMIAGRQRYLGLGPVHTVSLAEAREKALDARKLRLQGIDPLQARQQAQQARIAEQARHVTFKQVAQDYCSLHLEHFRNPKHRQQWVSTLATYAYPRLGNMVVGDISPADVLHCIEPHWNTKRETMSRVRQRVEKILDYAATKGFRSGDNPAAHVVEALPKNGGNKEHHEAMPYAEVPAFMENLRKRDTVSALALEFVVLTATRTGEVLGATWDEIDLVAKIWTIPAERMKANKAHRVPLSDRALEILQGLRHHERPFPLSHDTMRDLLLRQMHISATVHGFRSSFRDWAAERTNFPPDVCEMALAHAIKSKVEAAYRRSDLFEKRRKLMDAWASYCAEPTLPAKVVRFQKLA